MHRHTFKSIERMYWGNIADCFGMAWCRHSIHDMNRVRWKDGLKVLCQVVVERMGAKVKEITVCILFFYFCHMCGPKTVPQTKSHN